MRRRQYFFSHYLVNKIKRFLRFSGSVISPRPTHFSDLHWLSSVRSTPYRFFDPGPQRQTIFFTVNHRSVCFPTVWCSITRLHFVRMARQNNRCLCPVTARIRVVSRISVFARCNSFVISSNEKWKSTRLNLKKKKKTVKISSTVKSVVHRTCPLLLYRNIIHVRSVRSESDTRAASVQAALYFIIKRPYVCS